MKCGFVKNADAAGHPAASSLAVSMSLIRPTFIRANGRLGFSEQAAHSRPE